MKTKEHNYVRKVEEFVKKHGVKPGELNHIGVNHDDWCGIHKGVRCNCNPVVEFIGSQRLS